MDGEKEQIRFKYVFSEEYTPDYVNGAWGGATAAGEIVANFYLERHAIPREVVHPVKNEMLGEEASSKPDDYKNVIIRCVQSGVVMNLDTAKKVHTWLGAHIVKIEKERLERS